MGTSSDVLFLKHRFWPESLLESTKTMSLLGSVTNMNSTFFFQLQHLQWVWVVIQLILKEPRPPGCFTQPAEDMLGRRTISTLTITFSSMVASSRKQAASIAEKVSLLTVTASLAPTSSLALPFFSLTWCFWMTACASWMKSSSLWMSGELRATTFCWQSRRHISWWLSPCWLLQTWTQQQNVLCISHWSCWTQLLCTPKDLLASSSSPDNFLTETHLQLSATQAVHFLISTKNLVKCDSSEAGSSLTAFLRFLRTNSGLGSAFVWVTRLFFRSGGNATLFLAIMAMMIRESIQKGTTCMSQMETMLTKWTDWNHNWLEKTTICCIWLQLFSKWKWWERKWQRLPVCQLLPHTAWWSLCGGNSSLAVCQSQAIDFFLLMTVSFRNFENSQVGLRFHCFTSRGALWRTNVTKSTCSHALIRQLKPLALAS